MSEAISSSKRVLDLDERISEILFGLIMVLTFTGSLSVATAGRNDVRAMLVAAVGCNLAWGIIDGVLYLMGCLAEKGRNLQIFRAVRDARTPQKARQLILEAMPPVLASVLQPPDLEILHERLRKLPELPAKARLSVSDWRGALGVFLLVFISTFPVAVPFILIGNTTIAMRVSNAVAMFMLFSLGAAYGRYVGRSQWLVGISIVILGFVLVALTMALGG